MVYVCTLPTVECSFIFVFGSFSELVAVQRPSRRLYRMRLFFYPLTSREHGSLQYLTTRDRELVFVLELRIEPGI